jgi:hypothetical protein
MPLDSVRLDLYDHFPTFIAKRQRCMFPGCSMLTSSMCEKCVGNYFCCNLIRNCFYTIHHE